MFIIDAQEDYKVCSFYVIFLYLPIFFFFLALLDGLILLLRFLRWLESLLSWIRNFFVVEIYYIVCESLKGFFSKIANYFFARNKIFTILKFFPQIFSVSSRDNKWKGPTIHYYKEVLNISMSVFFRSLQNPTHPCP